MLNSLSDIEAFVRVADTLNFTRAANDLHVTPTAVSKAVARLEDEINAKLFIRTTRQVQLTAEGELFRARCLAAFAEISAGLSGIEVLRDQSTGPVRLSAPFILGRRLAASLPDLMARHANLDLRLSLTDDYVNLADEQIDIAIRIGAGKPSLTYEIPLVRLNWVTVASPRYLQHRGTPESIEALSSHSCHHFSNTSGEIVPWKFRQGNGIRTLTPGGGAQFNNGELLVEVAQADGGIVQVFDYMVRDELQNGNLIRLFADQEVDGPVVHAVLLPDREQSPKIKATLQHLNSLFEGW